MTPIPTSLVRIRLVSSSLRLGLRNALGAALWWAMALYVVFGLLGLLLPRKAQRFLGWAHMVLNCVVTTVLLGPPWSGRAVAFFGFLLLLEEQVLRAIWSFFARRR